MTTITILSLCATFVVSVLGVAGMFTTAWVKASDILKLGERQEKLQAEIDKLWERFTVVAVLETKIKSIEDGIHEIKELLKR